LPAGKYLEIRRLTTNTLRGVGLKYYNNATTEYIIAKIGAREVKIEIATRKGRY